MVPRTSGPLGARLARIRAKVAVAAACALLSAASLPAAGTNRCGAVRQADLARGARIAQACGACHGRRLSTEFARGKPAYSAPRIGHQRAVYLRTALIEYREGVRGSPIMRAQAQALTRADIEDVAAYYDAMPDTGGPAEGHHAAAVRRVGLDQIPLIHRQVCGACHGEAGLGILPESPILAGQYADYLEHALRAYADGERRSKVMGPFARALTSRQIREVAQYFSKQSLPERLPGAPMSLPLPLQ